MKRTAKALFTLALCIGMTLALTACSNGGGSSSMEGKYVISSMMVGEDDYLEQVMSMAEAMEEEINLEDIMYFEFSGADTVIMGSEGETVTGTYKLDGKTLTLTADGEEQIATVDGNSFTIKYDEDGMQGALTFTKK